MVDIPINTDSMVSGLGYVSLPSPATDAASLEGAGTSQIPDLPQGEPSPTVAVSLETKSMDAPGNPQTWNSGDKGTDWMGGSTLPWEK